MNINLPCPGYPPEEFVGEQYYVDDEPVGEVVGHVNTGMNQYLTIDVADGEEFERIQEQFDLYGRTPR